MMRVSSVGSSAASPKRRRKSTTGITVLRRLISPLMKSGVCGTRVIWPSRMISRYFSNLNAVLLPSQAEAHQLCAASRLAKTILLTDV